MILRKVSDPGPTPAERDLAERAAERRRREALAAAAAALPGEQAARRQEQRALRERMDRHARGKSADYIDPLAGYEARRQNARAIWDAVEGMVRGPVTPPAAGDERAPGALLGLRLPGTVSVRAIQAALASGIFGRPTEDAE